MQLDPPLVTDMRQDMARLRQPVPSASRADAGRHQLAGAGSPWLAFGEEVLDVEMVHALAPAATLVILLVTSTSLDNTANAVAAAVASLRLGSTEAASSRSAPPGRSAASTA